MSKKKLPTSPFINIQWSFIIIIIMFVVGALDDDLAVQHGMLNRQNDEWLRGR